MKKLERRAQKMRRIAVMGIFLSVGFVLGGNIPTWGKVILPAALIFWLMAYDDVMYEIYEKNAK